MNKLDPFTRIAEEDESGTIPKPAVPTCITPVPADAPPAPQNHPTLGKPSANWAYLNAEGRLLGYIYRFDGPHGKQFRPLTLWERGGSLDWQWMTWPGKRPLYGLQRLAECPLAPVVVCEGEKAADGLAKLLSDYVAVTSPNGARSAQHADWSLLRDRRVIIWPDADAAGAQYASSVAELILSAADEYGRRKKSSISRGSVAIAQPPPGCTDGWDAANALEEGWTTEEACDLIEAAIVVEASTDANENHGTARREPALAKPASKRSQRDLLVEMVNDSIELWHDANRTAYATFTVSGHLENWAIRSRDCRLWLSGYFYRKTGKAIVNQALEDAVRTLEARAVNEGAMRRWFLRVGEASGKLYLDLGDETWRAVEITPIGWRVIDKPPVKFLRSQATRPLPAPEAGSLIEEMRRFLNVKSEGDFKLIVAWIIAALRNHGPHPVLVISGEAGTGKSFFSRLLRALVDPSAAPIRAVPKDDRDLILSASNSWALVFDNVSNMPPWLADGLCRIATGTGFATRKLYSDADEAIFEAARPIVINGIPNLTDRADLADRSLTVHLCAIRDEERLPEDELLAEFEQAKPRILGALLDGVSAALRNISTVKLTRAPRMADVVKWVTAAEAGLGWGPGSFLSVYEENRKAASAAAFEADSVAVAIENFLKTADGGRFDGTATQLLAEINPHVTEAARRSKHWPQNAAQLGNRISRATPLLRSKNYVVERHHSGERTITIIAPQA